MTFKVLKSHCGYSRKYSVKYLLHLLQEVHSYYILIWCICTELSFMCLKKSLKHLAPPLRNGESLILGLMSIPAPVQVFCELQSGRDAPLFNKFTQASIHRKDLACLRRFINHTPADLHLTLAAPFILQVLI